MAVFRISQFLFLVSLISILVSSVMADVEDSYFAPAASVRYPDSCSSITFNQSAQEYEMIFQDGDDRFEYHIPVMDPQIRRGLFSGRGVLGPRTRSNPIFQSGFIVKSSTGELTYTTDRLAAASRCNMVTHSLSGNTIRFLYEETMDGEVLKKEYTYTLKGKTIVLGASATINNSTTYYYAGFDLSRSRYTNNPEILDDDSFLFPVVYADKEYYMTTYVDPLLSTTGRYETNAAILSERSVQASNSPAWLIPGTDGKNPPLKVVAYVTLSQRLTDVLPIRAIAPDANVQRINNRIAFDLHEFPLARRPLESVEVIRRWDSPISKSVFINGTFALQSGDTNRCEVHLFETSTGKSHVLYSQVLDPIAKPAAGIEGEFPISKGDQLLFVTSGPAVVTGGGTVLDIALEQDGEHYYSMSDFSNHQGDRNWYYEQRIGPHRTLMIWNPQLEIWESPIDRSYQSVELSVCRSGRLGDAFLAAEGFFDELRDLGLSGFSFLVQDWSGHARFALPSETVRDRRIWGSAQTLKRLTDKEIQAGNLIVDAIPPGLLDLPPAPIRSASPTVTSPTNVVKNFLNALSGRMAKNTPKMTTNAVLLDAPAFTSAIKDASFAYYHLMTSSTLSSRSAYQFGRETADAIGATVGGPVLLRWNDRRDRFDRFLAPILDGMIAPDPNGGALKGLVDIDVEFDRLGVPKLGFGSYNDYNQSAGAAAAVDPRLFPFDHYLTSTAAYARVPYISSHVWYPGLDARGVRRHLTEIVSLIQSVALEYRDPRNQTVAIRYDTAGKKGLTAENIIHEKLNDSIQHVTVEYANGLVVHANFSNQPWRIDRDNGFVVHVAAGGFLAYNPQTKLMTLIGTSAGRSFSVQQTPKTFFLHSRDGKLLSYESLATDGMARLWTEGDSPYRNIACLAATEINQLNPMIPILRSNARVDCTVHWLPSGQVIIKILEAGSDHAMLEYFDVPQDWFGTESLALTVSRQRPGESDTGFSQAWSVTSSASRRGLRLTDVRTNDVYTIARK